MQISLCYIQPTSDCRTVQTVQIMLFQGQLYVFFLHTRYIKNIF